MSTTKNHILVVDDEPINLKVLSNILRDLYSISVAKDGPHALARVAAGPKPDLILLDVMMPDMDGLEVCQRLKQEESTAHIPVIFVTALGQPHNETQGFEAGAVDYITKPISPSVVLARIRTHIALVQTQRALRDHNLELERLVAQRTQEVVSTQDVTIRAMASLAETRDNETGNHVKRTQHYVRVLAERLRNHPSHASVLDDRTIGLLFKSAPLHDIGKVGIPDAILLKPGKLTDAEFDIMKKHPDLGRNAILAAEESPDDHNISFLRLAREIAHSHHEKWDGSGYPLGLSGTEIPLAARLMALADVYDALISRRVYKPPFPHEKAVEIIMEGRGRHFDPDILDAFALEKDAFKTIADSFSDAQAPETDAS
ncbi:MAG: two-component system response regulator, partial [Magnetococcales bacterium]|nr:two-component system response regulator [Magnetococcales bacterium]